MKRIMFKVGKEEGTIEAAQQHTPAAIGRAAVIIINI